MKGIILLLQIIFEFWIGVTVAQVALITADDPDLRSGGSVCPRVVTFTCVTTGSPTIAWSSNQYIGMGNAQLTFAASVNAVGDSFISRIDDRNIAIFTQNNINTNGERELESILRLYILPNSGRASISCGQTSFRFSVIADPGPPRQLRAMQQPQYGNVAAAAGSCIVEASWKSPVNSQSIIDYMISTNGTNLGIDITVDAMHHDKNAKLSTYWLVHNCTGDPHSISVRAINTCGRSGPERSTVTKLDSRRRGPGSAPDCDYHLNNVMIVKCSCTLLVICISIVLLIMMLS